MKKYLTKNNLFTLIAVIAFGFCLSFGVSGRYGAMVQTLIACGLFLLFGNLDRIARLKLDKSGFEAETREVVREARSTIKELQDLSKIMALSTLGLVKRSGRWGGYSYDDKEKIKDETLSVLRRIGISDEECERIVTESKWYSFTELDYVLHILGGSHVPNVLSSEQIAECKELRHRGLDNIATPEELRKFFEQIGLLNTEVQGLIEDYSHYIKYRQQRRPDIWNNRASWSHFQKQRE